jgi:hypothetical protein
MATCAIFLAVVARFERMGSQASLLFLGDLLHGPLLPPHDWTGELPLVGRYYRDESPRDLTWAAASDGALSRSRPSAAWQPRARTHRRPHARRCLPVTKQRRSISVWALKRQCGLAAF